MLDRPAENLHIPGKTVVRIPWYQPEQWDKLLEVSEDRDELASAYEEWHKKAKRRYIQLTAAGQRPVKVVVDVDALMAWCKKHGKPVNAESREQFVTLPAGESPVAE